MGEDIDTRPDPAGGQPAAPGHSDGALAVLEAVARGEPLPAVLEAVAGLVEARSAGTRCAVFTVREGDLVLGAAPTLPEPFRKAVQRVPGAAVHLDQAAPLGVLPAEIADAAYRSGVGFGWGAPVVDAAGGRPVGCLAFFTGDKRFPDEAECEALGVAGTLAAVALVRAAAEEAAGASARLDPLTGLLNRPTFVSRLPVLARRAGDQMTLVLVDLVGFAGLNQAHGFGTGDQVLRAVAGRLRGTVRGRDLVARFGGDQFAVAGTGRRGGPESGALPARVRDALADPVLAGDLPVPVQAALGVVTAPLPVPDCEALLLRAEDAVRQAKDRRGSETPAEAGFRGLGRRVRIPRSGSGRGDR